MSIQSIEDLKQDQNNPNKGNVKGREMIGKSLDKFGTGRSILADKNGNIIAGNNVHTEALKRNIPIKVIQTTGDELIVVQRTDVDLYSEEGRELSLADNATAKANITWDSKVLKTEFKDVKLREWGLTIEKEIKSTPIPWVPDMAYKSSNEWEIPDLILDASAPQGIVNPFMPWGSQKRDKKAGTYHFYVDDYRFQTIWDKPDQVINSGCTSIVEPNLSTDSFIPMAYGAFLIFKKRYFARMLQEHGVRVYVDMHVHRKFADVNLVGVPPGWNAFATRGYADEIEELIEEINTARQFVNEHSGNVELNMIVYGGGKEVESVVRDHGCMYVQPFTAKHHGKGED